MSTIEILNDTVYVEHNGYTIGIPKEIIMQAAQQIRALEPMTIMNCPQCGPVGSYTGTCQYCGSREE